jgi:nicotinate dehydrogenase subunit A
MFGRATAKLPGILRRSNVTYLARFVTVKRRRARNLIQRLLRIRHLILGCRMLRRTTWGQSFATEKARETKVSPVTKTISLKVNGREHSVVVDPSTPLLFVLNDELGLRGPRFGCGMAQCGACTVIMDGRVIRSCVMAVDSARNSEITTLEGLGTPEHPHPIQQAFVDEGAAQCGFCLSGVILTAKALLDANPNATEKEIRDALGGVLCRCFTHLRMLRAIREYAEAKKP